MMTGRLLRRTAIGLLAAALAVHGDSYTGVERVVAVGDVHGHLAGFTDVLRSAGLIDAKNKWAGGKAHLVQLGDVPDRGPDTRKILDLLMDLEKQAKKAGGMVHPLIGNHEAMNVYGDLRYVIPEEYASFKSGSSAEYRSRLWEQHLEELKAKGQEAKATPEYKKKWEAEYPLGFIEHRMAFGPDGKYHRWLRTHNAIVRINDTLFLHGGLSPKYGSTPHPELNDRVRKEIMDAKMIETGILADPLGPLWYRGLAQAPEPELADHVEKLLSFYNVKRIVLGHTPTAGAILPRFKGKVILADVGLSTYYGARSACLVIENGTAVALHRGKKLTLPEDGMAASLLAYLKEAAALEPAGAMLANVVKKMESQPGALAIDADADAEKKR
ncbi:MAG TPA: protein-tyrosine-phosphatase [Solibacterales bacterium]|nr:protein-tyrosine-phosphatase [Bryobacterales bacterium]